MPRRPRKGDRRIDAFIDHFVAMGYAASHVNSVVGALVKVYGGPSRDVWRALEENSYEVVQNRLFEIEEEERQKQEQDQQLLLEYNQQQDGQQVEDEPPQDQEPAADNEVEDPMFIEPQVTISISSNEVPAETESADKVVEDQFVEDQFIEPPAREVALPLNAARTTRPCYGWLDESEDEEEEQPTGWLIPSQQGP